MDNSVVTGKINLGAISPIVRKILSESIPAYKGVKLAWDQQRLNQVKIGETNGQFLRPLNSRVGGLISPSILREGVMQISTDPTYLRDRANAAEIAGDIETANSLRAEANELESGSTTDTTVPL